MDDDEPTVRSRELGLAVHHAMRAAGLNQTDLARKLKWVPSRVSRMLSGKRRVSMVDMSAVLAVLDITGPKRQELLRLAGEAAQQGWWQEYGDRLPPVLRTLHENEERARAIDNFENAVVPGLLQTPTYMRALMEALPTIPEGEIEDRVEARTLRQRIFDRSRNPARFRFIIDEYAITRVGPGRKIMSEQVHHLLRMSVRPNVEIRVIPDSVGFHAGQGHFFLMDSPENPVLFLDSPTSALFVERGDTIAGYKSITADLGKAAMDEQDTRAWLAVVASRLSESPERINGHSTAPIYELEG